MIYEGRREGMNLQELIDKQRELDTKIVKEKGLEGQDLFSKKVLALLTELGEFANETRCFKYWSNDQDPRTKVKIHCEICGEKEGKYTREDEGRCPNCYIGEIRFANRVLEEYIDCVHFFLSLAIYRGWEDHLYINEVAIERALKSGVTEALLETKYWVAKMYMENDRDESFKNAWYVFLAIGMAGFGFTWEKIYEAYLAKNRINHERQATGY